ncbi:glycosyltransferase family 87 protein [Mycobacterium terramassiliense]|uniref:glycosyltransferase family 87 protein n=1 Tax=Mycobacterium terramassiliense TaxID=1841859 RepID=UPI00097D8B83|nr:glycosyltransferase family 87 protein [Mycobacterium terramassiliense]
MTAFVLGQYFSIDALSSLVFVPDDCQVDWGTRVGRHCFSDYGIQANVGMQANPWGSNVVTLPDHSSLQFGFSNYPAAGMLPQTVFGFLGRALHAPKLGLVAYLLLLTMAALTPAVWAARGARGLERVVVFFACGTAAIPAWMVIDRGNSTGFVVPIALAFLVALCRQRWGLVTVMVILAALVKPQFAVLGMVLFAARQWRWAGTAVAGVALSNIAAYLLWPRDFPQTIVQSIHNTLGYGSFKALIGLNVSFGKALLILPDSLEARATGGNLPDGFLAGPRSVIGYVVLLLVVVSVLALGRRIPPVLVGIMLLATACLFPAVVLPYYLAFALPIAALVVRDPAGPPGTGIFDRLATVGDGRRAVGICVTLAAALSIAHIALPSPPLRAEIVGAVQHGLEMPDRWVVVTTASFAALLWLLACGVIVGSFARRPAPIPSGDQRPAGKVPVDPAVAPN